MAVNLQLTLNAPVDDSQVKSIQRRVIESIDLDPLMFDQKDVSRVKRDLWYCTKFYRGALGSEDLAYERMLKSLKWRKANGVNDISFESLNKQFTEMGIAFERGKDRNGSTIIILNIRMYQKDPNNSKDLQKIIIFALDKHFWYIRDQKVVMLFDMSETGLSNMDLDMVKFIISIFKEHYPDTLAYLMVYDLPWILNAAWAIIKSWLSSTAVSKIKFVNKSNIQQYIAPDQLLKRYGGEDTWVFEYSPELYTQYEAYLTSEKEQQDEMSQEEDEFADTEMYESIVCEEGSGQNNRKQVRFDDSSYRGRSHRQRFSGDVNSTMRRRQVEKFLGYQGNTPGRSQSVGPLLGKENVTQETQNNHLISLHPSAELVFNSTSSSGIGVRSLLSLTNTSNSVIAYKIKTTSPGRYKVKPNVSSINPGQTTTVQILLIPDNERRLGPVSQDRFLVQACTLEDARDVADLNQLFYKEKMAEASNMHESVLMCRITEASHRPSSLKTSSPVPSGTVAPSEGTSSAKNPSSDISGIIGALKQLNMKIEAMSLQMTKVESQVLQVQKTNLILVIFIIIVLLFILLFK